MKKILAATAVAWLSLAPAHAQRLDDLGPAGPLLAREIYCARHPDECRIKSSEPQFIHLDETALDLMRAVTLKVNLKIRPVTDLDHWGVIDRWDMPKFGGEGDCEDFQLLKRKLLVQAGFPRRVLRMTVVIDELGEGHAVLMVRTDAGDFVLDNKNNRVLRWDETPYVYVKRESQNDEGWVSLGGRSAPAAAASVR